MKNIPTIKKSIFKIQKNFILSELIKFRIKIMKNTSKKLDMLKYLIYFNVFHFAGRYSDCWIEKMLVEYGCTINFQHREEIHSNSVLHVVTKAYETGGHTSALCNWIKYDSSRKNDIVFTDLNTKKLPGFLGDTVKKNETQVFYLHGDDIKKAEGLLEIADKYEKIVLHIHMFDIVPLIAFSNSEWKRPVYFFNHANFRFSIGVSIADCFLCICRYDQIKAVKYRGARNTKILPTPLKSVIDDNKSFEKSQDQFLFEKRKKFNLSNEVKIIISMGSDFKYKQIEGFDFPQFALSVVNTCPNTYFFIIGADPTSKMWADIKEKSTNKVIALGVLNRMNVAMWMNIADAFVTSYPMISAGAEDALVKDIPVFSLNVTNRMKQTFMEQTCYSNVNEMVTAIKNVLFNDEKCIDNSNLKAYILNDRKRWNNKLNSVYNEDLTHSVEVFKSKPIITKEEIINMQLLNDTLLYENEVPFRKSLFIILIEAIAKI